MGWDYAEYAGRVELFRDSEIWILRHFCLEECKSLEQVPEYEATTGLRQFFEKWQWVGPGVVLGTNFSDYIGQSHAKYQQMQDILQRTGDRIASFGDSIALSYLVEHLATPDWQFNGSLPTRPLLLGIGRLCSLLSQAPP